MGQSLKIALCGTGGAGGAGGAGAGCCWQDGKRSIGKSPGVSAAEVHRSSDAAGPDPAPELSESDIYESRGTVSEDCSCLCCSLIHKAFSEHPLCRELSFVLSSFVFIWLIMTSLPALCVTSVCVAVGKPALSNPKPFTLFIYDSRCICLCLQQCSGRAHLMFLFK